MTDLQEQILSVYKAFKNLCDQNNLRYFACGGTLLGAVRHQGFIPWDDDIDIGMPLADYEKLIEIMRSSAQADSAGDYELLEYPWFGSKFHNKNSTFTHALYLDRPEMYTGVFIDVFAFIGLPDEAAERADFTQRMQSLVTKAALKDFYDYGSDDIKDIIANICELKAKYNFDKAEYVAIFSFTNFEYHAKWFCSLGAHLFEDSDIPVPSGYEAVLAEQYGDYMTLPPESDRVSHHIDLALLDLTEPYSYYANCYNKYYSDQAFAENLHKIKRHAGSLEDAKTEYAAQVSSLYAQNRQFEADKIELMQHIDSIYNSASYKIGHTLLSPLRVFRRGDSKGNYEPR